MTTPTNPVRVINSGPSLEMLLAALGNGQNVTFVISGLPETLRLNGMQIEEGSRRNWFVNGYDSRNRHLRLFYKVDSKTGKVMTD